MDITELEDRMKKTIDNLEEKLVEIRAGRANPSILNKIMVDYYGVPTPLNQTAGISVPEARLIVVQPWDKSLLKPIERAINEAQIGINPVNDGNVIRLTFPDLNEETRKNLVKDVKALGEEAKIAIRNVRRDGIDLARAKQKASEITEDELKQQEESVQKLTDKYINIIDEMLEETKWKMLKKH